MSEKSVDLPGDCWALIFNFLDQHREFESLSLVCNRFLAITNQLRFSLTIADPTIQVLPRFYQRFPNLRKLDFRQFHGNLDSLLSQISRSGLDLESLNISNQSTFPSMGLTEVGLEMKNLRELNCSNIQFLEDCDLIAIANSCPFLEVLDISNHEQCCISPLNGPLDSLVFSGIITDSGILALSSKLKRLHKIDLSGNQFVTDKSLLSLSLNCLLLREITILDCDFITQKGIGLAMRNTPNLNSISVNGIGIPSINSCFKESFVCTRALCEIDLSNSLISDELLYLVGEAFLPLRKLILSHCYYFTFNGISFLLSKYQFLEYLNLEAANFLTDQSMISLLSYLGNLSSINLNLCCKLSNPTFFALMRECPLLNDIKMETTNLGIEDLMIDFVTSPQVKSLHLARNGNLGDEFIKKVPFICPNLQVLDVSNCSGITEEGIVEILRSCCEIRHLEIKRCRWMKHVEIDFELPTLEVLRAQGSGIHDEALAMIGKSCCRLLHLDLDCCLNVTMRGVKEVVENCRLLREINLKCCADVNVNVLAWMVFSRPSLRKITLPCSFVPTECQKNFFLLHGCLVCNGY